MRGKGEQPVRGRREKFLIDQSYYCYLFRC